MDRSDIPKGVAGFKYTGTLLKKRGGIFRNVHGQNWQPRAFGLTKEGLLLYYEEPTITQAAEAGHGLVHPRQELDLKSYNCSWATPSDMSDAFTDHMLMITHTCRNVDNGQRMKLCVNSAEELQGWVREISAFCPKTSERSVGRTMSPMRSGLSGSGSESNAMGGGAGGASGSAGLTPRGHRRKAHDVFGSAGTASGGGATAGGGSGGEAAGRGAQGGDPEGSARRGGDGGTRGARLGGASGSAARPRGRSRLSISLAGRASGSNGKYAAILAAAKPGFLAKGSVSDTVVLLAALNAACGALFLAPDETAALVVVAFINLVVVVALLTAHDRGSAVGALRAYGGATGLQSLMASAASEGSADGLSALVGPGELLTPGKTIARVEASRAGDRSGRSIVRGGSLDHDPLTDDGSSDGGFSDSGAGSGDEGGGGTRGRLGGEGSVKPPFPSFSAGDKESFKLRTVGYKKHQKKAASSAPLYDLVAMDLFKTPCRLDEIHKLVDIDTFTLPDTAHPDVPAMLIMNLQFPTEKQEFFTDGNGPGCSVVMYFKITDTTLASVKSGLKERSNALKLFIEWCRLAPDDPVFRGRFKAMGFINDIKNFGIPAIAAKYNGKPVLIKKTGKLYRGENFIEMDVNIHRFSYPCRTTLIHMKEKFGEMIIRCGFTIEGRDDEELPEVLLGCANLNGVNLDAAINLS